MKTKLFFIGMLLWSVSMLGQKKFETKEYYLEKINESSGIPVSLNKKTFAFALSTDVETLYDINNAYQDYMDDIKFIYTEEGRIEKTTNLYNPKMLNVFIANNIGSYVSSSKDLSLQNFYAVLDANDKSFFFGGTWSFGGKYITDRIKNVATAGVKTSAKDNYASLFENGKATKGIGINLKLTHIFTGSIKFNNENNKILNCFRDKYLKEKYTKDVTIDTTDITLAVRCIKNTTSKKEEYEAVYDSIAEDEIKFITDNKLYTSFKDYWLAVELYIPITKKENYISDVITNPNYSTIQYCDWKASITANFIWKWSSKNTLNASLSATLYNNNTILTNDLAASDFQTIQSQGTNTIAILDTQSVYVGNFKQFTTSNFKGEMTYFFFMGDRAGLSLAYDKNIGIYQATNWKAGVPISFKDVNGKPSVNLELQWKEINKNHYVGFGIGYVFGSYVK